jgi:hypothetical protein
MAEFLFSNYVEDLEKGSPEAQALAAAKKCQFDQKPAPEITEINETGRLVGYRVTPYLEQAKNFKVNMALWWLFSQKK